MPDRSDRTEKTVRVSRREALTLGAVTLGSLAVGVALRGTAGAAPVPLRPPGALREDEFLGACIRCFQCGSVCPNQAIKFLPVGDGAIRAFTPYIEPREQSCILCMKCTQACPTNALTPIDDDPAIVAREVKMGVAKISEHLCYSYNDRICGVCYYACPYPDQALSLGLGARPIINEDACVGCGNCERACIHLPQAVRIEPNGRDERAA